jgi:hypothetical protein
MPAEGRETTGSRRPGKTNGSMAFFLFSWESLLEDEIEQQQGVIPGCTS